MRTPIFYAAGNNFTQVVEFLIQKGADINARNLGNETPIMRAAFFGCTQTVALLMEAGADLNAINGSDNTVEDIARINGKYEVLNLI